LAANFADSLPELKQSVTQKHKRGDASYTARIAPLRFKPGQSGNPGGVPKHDVSKEIAQAHFSQQSGNDLYGVLPDDASWKRLLFPSTC
jgi:hypothetical protein